MSASVTAQISEIQRNRTLFGPHYRLFRQLLHSLKIKQHAILHIKEFVRCVIYCVCGLGNVYRCKLM